jgi:4-hydroxybenzoyl-CoA reductase subunit beta
MMRLPRFHYFSPERLSDAAKLLADHGPDAQVVAGGTDLWPNMKRRQQTPRHVIGLRRIAQLFERSGAPESGLSFGAMTSLTQLERDPALRTAWPALAKAAQLISTPPLRNMGTLGGNLCLDTRCNYYDQNYEWRKAIDFCMKKDGQICWVAPGSDRCWAVASSDTAPVLMAIGAEVTLISKDGERRIRLDELFQDDGIRYLTKRPDEILTQIHLPPQDGRTRTVYWKLRRRESFDFPVLGVAVAARFSADRTIESASVVLTGTGSRPQRAPVDKLIGNTLNENVIQDMTEVAARLAKPLDNTDFFHGWRKQMAKQFIAGALRQLWQPSA